ncbi:MAG: NAD(P)/FAD-dependent oxidoreductase [Pyrinomonadaceae bacterium]|nr:NAD(P)/FAD-dependent oxidoreductase [Pyrinomonadaceae bacterium]
MINSEDTYDVAIAGAGPAGTSAAIHLATQGARVLLVEQKRFPRAKLCGEFISPECLRHFDRLGVADQMISAGATTLTQTVFYSRKGRSVNVPSEWFGANGRALGLSRSEMDQKLLERAKDAGVLVLEDTHASDLILDRGRVLGLRLKCGPESKDHHALVTVDATGRTRALARRLNRRRKQEHTGRYRLVAFKAHLENAQASEGACEIYFYPGGYGGLSSVEGGVSNFCFIASAKDVRRCGSDPEAVIRASVFLNSRAAYTLAHAHARTEWLSVSLEGFGRRKLVPAEGLLTIGDAAAFIDPFSGSGMLIALESGELAAQTITNQLERLRRNASFTPLAREYRLEYQKKFDSRLRICSLLRRAAFVPSLAEAAILFFGTSTRLRRRVARITRPSQNLETPPSSVR